MISEFMGEEFEDTLEALSAPPSSPQLQGLPSALWLEQKSWKLLCIRQFFLRRVLDSVFMKISFSLCYDLYLYNLARFDLPTLISPMHILPTLIQPVLISPTYFLMGSFCLHQVCVIHVIERISCANYNSVVQLPWLHWENDAKQLYMNQPCIFDVQALAFSCERSSFCVECFWVFCVCVCVCVLPFSTFFELHWLKWALSIGRMPSTLHISWCQIRSKNLVQNNNTEKTTESSSCADKNS